MDEGTRAIITEISRTISDNQNEKIEKNLNNQIEKIDRINSIQNEKTERINSIQSEKIERITREQNEHIDEKFEYIKMQIEGVKTVVDTIKVAGCIPTVNHVAEHEKNDKRVARNVTIISTIIPIGILLGSWIKGIIIGWIQKPHN